MARGTQRRYTAIVLDRTKLSEIDLILTLVTDSGAQDRVVAKGARKPGGRLAARCDLFCETDFLVVRGKNLGIVNEAQLVDAHTKIRGNMDRLSAASAISEVARLTCFEESEDAFLFPILSRSLRATEEVDDIPHLDLICAAYAIKVLAHSGWKPELGACVECGDENPTWFSIALGGVVCESCARGIEGAEMVSPTQIAWIETLLTQTFDELVVTEVDADMASWLVSLAHIWTATHLDARLRSWEFMLGV